MFKSLRNWWNRVISRRNPIPDGWPCSIDGRALSYKVNTLDLEGHKAILKLERFPNWNAGLDIWMWDRIGPNDTYLLVELSLPNCLDTVIGNVAATGQGVMKQVRWPIVRQYASLKTPFPPILFARQRHGKKDVLYDGLHRLLAARHRGDQSIMVYIKENSKPPDGFSIVDKSSL